MKDILLRYGQSGDGEKLEKFVQKQAPDELMSMMRASMKSSDGISLFLYILEGLQNKPATERTRILMVKSVLEEIMKPSCLQASAIKTFVEEIQNCVRSFSSTNLSDIVDFLQRQVEDLYKNEGVEVDLNWINIFANLLEEIKELDYITPKDHHIEITGQDFRKRIISSLCETRWEPRIGIAMAQMFQDAKLTSSELEEVFNKMLTVLNRSSVNDLAPLFHQLLKLISNDSACSAKLFNSITQYFISKLDFADRHGDGMESSDLIQSDHSSEEVQQTEAIIVYYIAQAAKIGYPISKEILRIARASVSFPSTILNPFGLLICLALTSVNQQSASIIESLKAIISKAFSICESRDSCAWFRENTPQIPNITDLFCLVISQSVRFGGWDLIGEGLVNLSFILLDVQPPLGKMNTKTRNIHSLASNILAKVIKKHPSSAQIIIPKLQDRIIVNGLSIQYTTALRIIVKQATTYLMEDDNGTLIVNFINNFHRLTYTAGRASFNALVPLLKLNRSLRNPLIVVLRKALFSKNVDTRKVGVSGVFIMLKSFKISNNMATSQSLSQSSGSLSQLSVDIHRGKGVTNESLCAELLGVLKRCFSLQPKVKMIFYGGISEVVHKNPDICEGCLELMNGHVVELFGSVGSDDTRINLELSKTITEKGGEWVISEPAGWFIHCLQTLVIKGQQLFSGEDSGILERLVGFLENVTQYYSNSDLHDLGFDVTDNYDMKTYDGKKRALKVEVLITIYEALMEYTMSDHGSTNVEKAETLLKLCQRYLALKNLLEGGSKQPQKKGGNKKEKAVKKENVGCGEDIENCVKAGSEKGTKRNANGKEKEKELEDYSMDLCAFSMKPICLFLKSILDDRMPENQAALSKLRNDTGLLTVIEITLNTLLDRNVSILARTGDEGVHSDNIFKSLLNTAAVLFRHCVTCKEPVEDFLQPGSQILYNYVKALFSHFGERKMEISCGMLQANIRSMSAEGLNSTIIRIMNELNKKMTEMKENISDNDELLRMLNSLVDVYCIFIDKLDGDKNFASVCDQVKKFCEDITNEDHQLCKAVVRMAFHSSLRLKFSVSLCPKTARNLHCIYGDLDTSKEVEASKNLGYLNPETADIVLPIMIEHMDSCIEYADQIIYWIKSFGGHNYPDNVNSSNVEMAITEMIAKMVTPSLELVNTALPAGKISEITLKFLCKLYKVLGNLANYYFVRTRFNKSCVATSKMDKLVKMVGQQLSPNVYSLITYVHKKLQEQEEEAKQARQRKNKVLDPNFARSKILKETKEIPNLIFQVEMFEKNMAKVSKRINQKFDFKLPTSRDFRIKLSDDQMKELIEDDESSDASSDESGDESQDGNSQTSVLNESKGNTSAEANTSEGPSAKKGKLSAKLSKMKEDRAK